MNFKKTMSLNIVLILLLNFFHPLTALATNYESVYNITSFKFPHSAKHIKNSNRKKAPKNTNSTRSTFFSASTDIVKLHELINNERLKRGLTIVNLDEGLSKAALLKSSDMNDFHYFSHTSPRYGNCRKMLNGMNIEFVNAAENIAINKSIYSVHSSFMSSTIHKSNILGNGWNSVGIGIVKRNNGIGIIVTEIFAKK